MARTRTEPALDPMLNVTEIARFLGMSEKWVYRSARREGVPLYDIGGRLRADRHELVAWRDRQRVA